MIMAMALNKYKKTTTVTICKTQNIASMCKKIMMQNVIALKR